MSSFNSFVDTLKTTTGVYLAQSRALASPGSRRGWKALPRDQDERAVARKQSREVALFVGATGSCRRGLHWPMEEKRPLRASAKERKESQRLKSKNVPGLKPKHCLAFLCDFAALLKNGFSWLRRIAVPVLLTIIISVPALSFGADVSNVPPVHKNIATLYFFKGESCPHCAEEAIFLSEIKIKYSGLSIKEFEVWHNKFNAMYYARVLQGAGVKRAGVPGTVIGKKLFIGYSEQTGKAIEDAVAACIREGCIDILAGNESLGRKLETGTKEVKVPILGEVDPERVSLPLLTVIIGAMDSFNPCAFFVLLFLLSMMIHARSRKKMLLIGGIFVFFSAFIYFLFMAAWLNIFLVIGKLTAITLTAGIVALIVAIINIKDFFFFKKGISLVIPETAKPKLFERMRDLLKSSSLTTMIAGTVVLAVFANAYELLCTVGFPMVYTRALTLHKLTTAHYYLYLVFYNIVYVIPIALIVVVITITLGARKLTEWQGRQLKLLSGLLMFGLGLILLIDPGLLNSVTTTGGLLLTVIIVSGLLIYGMKKIRPEIAGE